MEESVLFDVPDDTTSSLYPALFQCFTIILCGYVAGTMNVVSQTESKGIGTFVGTFALPSLIFLSLARLDFSSVNWKFLGAILFAKGVIFFAVIIVTLIISKPKNLGRAGIFAIFCTQSNDFALGFPIINAIYEHTHPEYALYLYLMAPISLAILNPVAFVLMEIHKQQENAQAQPLTESQRKSDLCKLKLLRQIVKGIAFNPVVVMTVLGILGNILFKHQISIYIEGLLEVFGQSFSASALFLLGLRMVGQIQRLRGPALLLPCVLIMIKLLVLPVVMRESVTAIDAGVNASETLSLSTYAFLYGTIPTAPAVFVFSNLYQLEMDLMASSMVICTVLSAPMMFVSAQLISISKDFAAQIKRFGYNISIASLVALVWVITVFIVTKKYQRMPHRLTLCLMISQLLLAISVIWGGPSVDAAPSWENLAQETLKAFSMYSCLLWTAMLSIGLLMLESRGACFVQSVVVVLALVAWGAAAAAAAAQLAGGAAAGAVDPVADTLIRMCLLVFCFTVSVGCLIVYSRYRRRSSPTDEQQALVEDDNTAEANGDIGSYGTITSSPQRTVNGCCSSDPLTANNENNDIEDLPESGCGNPTCSYGAATGAAAGALGLLPPETSRGRGRQMMRHTALVLIYDLFMFISITYTSWSIMSSDERGIFAEMQFLDVAACCGQGLVALAVFGLSADDLLVPAVRALSNKWFGVDSVVLPAIEDLSFETKHVCDQFITHHLERCKEAIAKDTRWRMRTYRGVFRGACLARWLRGVGLARDSADAVVYGRHLLDGRLIAHINNAHHFTDSPLLYTFK